MAILIVGFGTCLGGVTQSLGGVFQGMENMLAINSVLIVEKAVITGGCALLLWQGCGLLPVCWVHAAAACTSFLLNLILLGRQVRISLGWELSLLRRVFVGGFPFLIWVVFSEIYLRVGVLMLSLLATDAVVGWYGVSMRIYATLLFAPTILTNSIFPALMRMGAGADAAGGQTAFARAAERLMNLLLFVAVPISAGLIAVAGPLIRLLYGAKAFAQAAENLQVLGVSLLLVCVDILLGTVLIARGKEKPWARMAIAAAVFNPLLNLALIPLAGRLWGNGGIGVSIATLLTEALMMAGALWLMPPGVFSRRNLVLGVKGCLLGAAMVLLLRVWGTSNLFLLIGAGAAFYLPLALLWGLLPRADLAHLWHAVRRRE